MKDNKVTVTSPKKGTAYDTSKIQAELSNQLAADSIQLTAKVKTPLTKNSAAVKKEVAALKKLSNKKITYKVENKSYTLTSDDIITKATYQNGQYQFDTAALDQEIAKINKAQSTLGKSFKFKTHAGNTITTSAQGSYGWRISTTKATKTLTDALLKGRPALVRRPTFTESATTPVGSATGPPVTTASVIPTPKFRSQPKRPGSTRMVSWSTVQGW